ncbi:MAG: AAA family ATPase [Phycisphaerales bacterium]
MFIERLHIEGYKSFGGAFTIQFREGLNVLVGENAVGKSAIIDALRSVLLDDDFERKPISDTDFYLPFVPGKSRAPSFTIQCTFGGLSANQQVAFFPWTDLDGKATLTLQVENKENSRGRYKRFLWGGASRASMFERELFDAIDCIYLPPLRDAEAKLREGRSSRLARLFKNLNRESLQQAKDTGSEHSLVSKVKNLTNELSSNKDEHIRKANDLIRTRLRDAIGTVFGQDTQIKFTEADFGRIVESLRLFFFPQVEAGVDRDAFRSLEENSLGYNNLIYIATVLAELTEATEKVSFKALLIEEPEAHLHPQFQTKLLKYLEETAVQKGVQVIVTTHSPVLASAASIDSLIHLSRHKDGDSYRYAAVPLAACGLPNESKQFLSRWLDVTKSTLLFARGVILVEGIAEAMLLPELARRVLTEYNQAHKQADRRLPESLEEAGVSAINMNGVYFRHFMPLFCNLTNVCASNIPIYCSGVTDKDPPKDSRPSPSARIEGENPALELISVINRSRWARLYSSELKTFEYDLAFEADANRDVMIDILVRLWPSAKEGGVKATLTKMKRKPSASDADKAEVATQILSRIDDNKNIGKGLFAQSLADTLQDTGQAFSVPGYIRNAIIWACGGNPDDT